VHDAADHPPIINPMRTAPTTRQQPLDPPPLGVVQPGQFRYRKAPYPQEP
jgi:hypothetical protein